MNSMFTTREILSLIDYGKKVGEQDVGLYVAWSYSVIGINLISRQQFEGGFFDVSSLGEHGAVKWCVVVGAKRVKYSRLDDPDNPDTGFAFGLQWDTVHKPYLSEGTADSMSTDLMMLRMAKELWS